MNNYKIYIASAIALAVGLSLGWFLFNGGESPSSQNQHDHSTATTSGDSVEETWICSMHPQIRQNEPGDCPICGMDLIPAKQSGNDTEIGFQMTDQAVKLAQIQTTIIGNTHNTTGATLTTNGKIQANETKSASLVTHIPGRIEKLYVSYTGEQVNKDQKIATIYSPELITAQKELLEAQKIEDISPGLLAAAKNKLKYWKIGNQVIEDILRNGTIRETFDIYAEYTGVVDKKRVSVGDYLSIGEVLFDVQNLSNLWALFDIYENDLSKVRVGSWISFTAPSVPNKTYRSKVAFINPIIDPQTRVATIRAEVNNSNGKLKPEMFINGEIRTARKSTNLTVPKSAVLWTGKRSVVYLKVPNTDIPSFEYREIEIGESVQSSYAVITGLEDGDEVVTNGAFVIDASAQLNNQASMMNRNVLTKNSVQSSQLPDYTDSTPPMFKNQLSNVVEIYFSIKDAFVEGNVEQAAAGSTAMMDAVQKVDMSLVKEKAHLYWIEQLKGIKAHGAKISELSDIEDQRKQFDFLSQALIRSLKVFGVTSETVYVQHCPMANDNKGADWLSKHEKVLNPYFGDKMLTCGIVQDVIDKDFANPPIENILGNNQNSHNH